MKKRLTATLLSLCLLLTLLPAPVFAAGAADSGIPSAQSMVTQQNNAGGDSMATPSDVQPEECTCETLCTEEEINGDCPVCSVEGAELDKVCVGAAPMLPVTALAEGTAPQTLYVGSTTISAGYWTSSDGGTTWARQKNQPEGNNYIYYDGQGTLELHNATIHRESHTVSAPYGSGIYALSHSGQPVSLTIKLIGENTITGFYGIFLDAEASATSYGTDASLTITSENNGSLQVSGLNYGIYVKSGTGNASLTINDASVVAKTTQTYSSYAGVYVQSSMNATNSPQLSLKVDGGSLTASGTGSSDGIWFYVGSSEATGATTSLTISDNAIVRAENGINAYRVDKPTPSGTGIVFNDKKGTVYDDVTLDEPLTIGAGESLTIPDGSSLNCNEKLTNNGTIINNGTLTGEVGGTGKIETTPTIDTQPASQTVTKGKTATFTVEATGENLSYQWQQSADNGQSWQDIDGATNDTYSIEATTTSMSGYQYRCVVSNSAGSVTSAAATLTVTQPVTGVTLDPTELSLYTGESKTLTAKVEPNDATTKAVTWESSNTEVATVDNNGNVTAVGAGEATITVKATDGSNISDTCTVTVTQSTYSISADTTALDFGSAYTGYTQPAAKTVTITNDGNQTLTLTPPASTGSFEVGSLSKSELAAGEKATFTVQPKAGLAVGTYSENITVSGTGGATVTITANFTVQRYSSGGGSSSSTTSPSDQAIDKIEAAKDGSTVKITLRTGQTKLDKEVFEELAGRDVTLEITVPGGVTWTVNGQDIPENADLTDLDMGVSLNTSTIPVNLINSVTGEAGTVQLTLKHNGEFGFTMTLTAPVGVKNAGLWANLYHYDEDAGKMVYQTAALVDEDGNVALPFDHASQYALVLDSKSHDLPFTDLAANAWYTDAVAYVYRHDLMAGYGENLFGPDDDLSRAQLCQIIYNMEGQPATSGSSVFTDVADGAWYADAVTWAASQGIVGGYGNGLFGPEDNITREQLASILYRYAEYKGLDVSARVDLSAYSDQPSVWAEDVMQWAVAEGLLTGVSEDRLQPQGPATRAQVAAIFERFLENIH